MSRIFWDTNLFIYLFEDYGALSKAVGSLRSNMLDRGDQLLTSTLTLGEILVKPTERSDSELCRKYEHAISTAVTMISFDVKAAKIYPCCEQRDCSRRPTPYSWPAPQARTWTFSSPVTNGYKASTLRASSSSCRWGECLSEFAVTLPVV
jgi:predicted nucleic acid-binding protein